MGSVFSLLCLSQDDPKQRRPDISFAKRALDWEPNVALEEGLHKTIDYFRYYITYAMFQIRPPSTMVPFLSLVTEVYCFCCDHWQHAIFYAPPTPNPSCLVCDDWLPCSIFCVLYEILLSTKAERKCSRPCTLLLLRKLTGSFLRVLHMVVKTIIIQSNLLPCLASLCVGVGRNCQSQRFFCVCVCVCFGLGFILSSGLQ